MPAAGQRQPVERLLDVAVYAPVGLALTLCDRLPRQLRQRRQALENRVQLAKFFGELAVKYGKAEFEKQVGERRQADAVVPAAPPAVEASPVTVPVADVPPAADLPAAASLPIGDYESLAAIHVVERLGSLRGDEIEQIRRFEAAHRARRTILAKIAQLQDDDTP
ncbi:MAG: hypothetical protein JWN99_718 [Ilumatobacteraceae bacterium]|nr:hypothetical protein [Ilumatobacteraceae bacterium]